MGGPGKGCLFSAHVIPQLGMTKLEQIVRFPIACSRPPLLLIPPPPFRHPLLCAPPSFQCWQGIEGMHPPPFPCPSPFAHPSFVQAASLAPFTSLSLVPRRPSHALSLLLRGKGAQEWTVSPYHPLYPLHPGYATLTLVYAPLNGLSPHAMWPTQGSVRTMGPHASGALTQGGRAQRGSVQGDQVERER